MKRDKEQNIRLIVKVMAPVNPYLRNKPKHAAGVAKAPTQSSSNASAKAIDNKTMTTAPKPKPKSIAPVVPQKPRQLPVAPNTAPKSRPVAPTVTPKSRTSAPTGSVTSHSSNAKPSASKPVPVAKKPIVPFSTLSKPRKSFKSKLKDEIEALKRAKQLEKQRKLMEKQNKKLQQEELLKQQEANQPKLQTQQVPFHHSHVMNFRGQQVQLPSHPPAIQQQQQMPMRNVQQQASMIPTNFVTPAKAVASNAQSIQRPLTNLPSSSTVQQVTPAALGASTAAPAKASTATAPASTTPASFVPSNNAQSTILNVKSEKSNMNVSVENKASVHPTATIPTSEPNHSTGDRAISNDAAEDTRPKTEQPPAAAGDARLVSQSAHASATMPFNFPLGPLPVVPPYHPAMSSMIQPHPTSTTMGYVPPFGYHSYQQALLMMGHQPWSQSVALPPVPAAPPAAPRQRPTPKSAPAPSPPKTALLHHDPLHPVSPYSSSHTLLDGETCIFKKAGESFGVSFKYETQSVLVEPEVVEALNGMLGSANTSTSPAGKNMAAVSVSNGSGIDAKKNAPNTVATTSVSTNMPIPSPVSTETDVSQPAEKSDQAVKQRRPRRRRVFFGVLTVVTADKQNAQFKSDDPAKQLQPGDIILKINGHDLGGITFQQAICYFTSCNTKTDANGSESQPSLIRCPLVVARRKRMPTVPSYAGIPSSSTVDTSAPHSTNLPTLKVPFVVSTITDQIHSGDFTSTEVVALAQGAMRCLSTESRALGYVAPFNVEMTCLQVLGLSQREVSSIKAKQNHFIRSAEQSMKEAAAAHWSNQWKLEQEKSGGSDTSVQHVNLSDAQRSALRELPRPLKGCRCGGTNHEYVNDSKCVLYRNLRALSETPVEPVEEAPKSSKKAKSINLNALETACKDRLLKLKEVTGREENEARFVERMEELQVKKVKMAVFAPSLTAMVLSSVAEVAKDLSKDDLAVEIDKTLTPVDKDIKPALPAKPSSMETSKIDVADVDEDSDDDDDIPLMALGKRSDTLHAELPEPKRLKVDGAAEATNGTNEMKERPKLDLSFLAEVLRHISHTWGHLYTEPSDADYSWRWEVHHGQTSSGEAYRDTKCTNPRLVGSRSFENIRFSLTDDVVSRLAASNSKSNGESVEEANDLLLMSHLLSPKRTGVYDEILALVTMGVLQRTRSGCVVLADDWQDHVDPLILIDMDLHWSKRQDPMNKHCMSKSVRAKLQRTWTRVEGGWAMSSDPDDVIFRDDEWDEWRTHFQDRFNSQINEAEGIEKFGI